LIKVIAHIANISNKSPENLFYFIIYC